MTLCLLGGLSLTDPAGAAVALPTRKTALVLATLALLGEKGTTREALVELIWPDRAEGQGKSSLRQALTAVRKALPQALEEAVLASGPDGSLHLAAGDGAIDLQAFESLSRGGTAVVRRQAADLYLGDLLEGVALPEPLAALVAAHRERLRRQALDLVETMSEQDSADMASRSACEALANRLLTGDPAAEAAHRALIRLRLAEGQPNAARRQYERCAEAIRRDLAAAPEARTTALLDSTPEKTAPAAPAAAPQSERAAPAALPGRAQGQPTVVVMPFDDLGGSEDDFFADGVVEEITAALSRIKDFFVIARQSAYAYKGRFVDLREVGRDLGVRYAVEGTVRRGGGRVRITVQLVETASDRQLWAERYEDDRSELFDLQDRIASQVAGAINPSIRASEIERARQTPPENLQAYDVTLRALPHFWAHRKEDNEQALALFDQALAMDPDYGVALAFKAWCHAQQACYLWAEDPGGEKQRAIETADRAARRVQDHATALTAIGAAYSMTTTDQERAGSFIERALTIDPNNAWAWMRAGWMKTIYDQIDGALECFERALALSPYDPFAFNMYFGMAAAYGDRQDYRKAIELVEKGLRAGPGVTWAYRMLASYLAQAGEPEKAARAIDEFRRHNPGVTIEKLRVGLPPSMLLSNPNYLEGMRKAGIPER
ncbi:MAG: BTAD domain-containing putative transcriptional regulator [Kiloniellaceae bacterium]